MSPSSVRCWNRPTRHFRPATNLTDKISKYSKFPVSFFLASFRFGQAKMFVSIYDRESLYLYTRGSNQTSVRARCLYFCTFVSSDAFVTCTCFLLLVKLNPKDGPMMRARRCISLINSSLTAGRSPAHLDLIILTRFLALLCIF